jgi:pyridoxal phosphate-dependent aminotransferase EpsN
MHRPDAAMTRIPLSVPHASGREQEHLAAVLDSNWLSTVGPALAAFEAGLERRVGRPVVALASGTAAMHLGLALCGVGPGDEVLCPTFTFIASVNPAVYLGARPTFIDSEPRSWNLDPALLEETLAERARRGRLPRAVIVVHTYGQCAEMDPILAACARHGVPVLEDAAEAVGATYRGRPAGALADVGVFSFNGNKIITTAGGGALLARDPAHAEKARFWSMQARAPGPAYQHAELGYNYRMSNVLAAIGNAQLEVLDARVASRRRIAARYRAALADVAALRFMPEHPDGVPTSWLSCVLLEPGARIGRDDLIGVLDAADIEARPLWRPMHRQPLYRAAEVVGGTVAEDLALRGLCLPSSSSLTDADQDRVIEVLRRAVRA